MGVFALCVQGALAGVIIDGTSANGNGSFEFDASGDALTADGAPGKWVSTSGDLTIDGNVGELKEITTVFARDAVASDGSYSLRVDSGFNGNPSVQRGGVLNTGYVVGADDEFTFSFDWRKTDNKLGAANFDVFVFTSSNDALDGTLTSLYKGTFGSGPAMASFVSVSLTSGDFTIAGANEGKKLFVAFAAGGYTQASNTSPLNIDNLSLTVISEPATPANLIIDYNTGQLSVTATEMASGAANTLQGTMDLVTPNWVDLSTTTGVDQVTWLISESETNRFFRVESN
ncbi:hypothetical protein PDESU_01220 [Pontiella desulfatans]|uniref:Uncharacterized protein n=1 Tax=Pontiella desulfatans TaxID=2750659 RepID=A0A6C2TYH4_PONDE|nr:hypothetical protein PDESU_01220 [Pontiella desulfatans]